MRSTARWVATCAALAALGVFVWRIAGDSRAGSAAQPSAPSATAGSQRFEAELVSHTESAPQRAPIVAAETANAPSSPPASSSWTARFVSAGDGAALGGLEVELVYLPREVEPRIWRGRTDADGAIGPLEIDRERSPAAQLTVGASPRACGLRTEIEFVRGEREQVFELAGPRVLTVRVERSRGAVAGARVWIETADGVVAREALTDAVGRARFVCDFAGELGESEWAVHASDAQHAAMTAARVRAPPAGDVELVLFLAASASLEITLLDPAGGAVANACLRARPSSVVLPSAISDDSARGIASAFAARTDDTGRATFASLPSGTALAVEVGCEGRVDVQLVVDALAAGELAQVVLTLPAKDGVWVLVEDELGRPVERATIGVDAASVGSTSASGSLAIPFRAEPAAVVWVDRAGYAFAWRADVDLSSTAGALRLVLEPESAISGVVVDADQKPARFARVRWLPAGGSVASAQLGDDTASLLTQIVVSSVGTPARTGSDGKFRVGGLPRGRHDLHVAPAKCATFEVRGVPAGTEDLRIVLPRDSLDESSTGPVFDVAVLDALSGAPIAGAAVDVWKLDAGQDGSTARKSSHDSRRRKSDSRGVARIAWPAPGWYAISASAEGYCDARSDYRAYDAGHQPETVRLTPACKLELRVVDAAGEPVTGAWLRIADGEGRAISLRVPMDGGHVSGESLPNDARGALPFQTVPAGRVVARACKDESCATVLAEQELDLRAGESRTLELRVAKP